MNGLSEEQIHAIIQEEADEDPIDMVAESVLRENRTREEKLAETVFKEVYPTDQLHR